MSNMNFNTCELQGKLFLHDQIQKAFVRKNVRQADADYKLPPGLTIKDECSRSFRIAKSAWEQFTLTKSRKDVSEEQLRAAVLEFARNFFGYALGYQFRRNDERVFVGGRGFAVHAFVSGLPVVISPLALDELCAELAIENGGRSRKTCFQAIQEFLNASDDYDWGFAFNGDAVRLVRDAMSLTRPSYLEFNLREIFSTESFSEFLQLWAVLHESRTVRADGRNVWEDWIKAGEDNGQPIRDKLSEHVTQALYVLGNGFLQEETNIELREALGSGRLSPEGYVYELLRLMYRFLFVFCLEERGLLHTAAEDDAGREAVARYQEGYSLHRYRDQSTKRRFFNRYSDAWDAVRVVFRSLHRGEPALALPALGGLFDEKSCPWLDRSTLANRDFFETMKLLRWVTLDGVTAAIDYKNLGTEELGSVYEGLLELVPVVDVVARKFAFVGLTNVANDRKDTGSYYTPDALVQSLIKTALDPVIEETLAKHPQNPTTALLNLSVIDPTCGSGHFLLAAARRIAEALSLARSVDGVVTPDGYREALRDVIQHCIYGVDINPLAVELARMALWLEGFSRGKPLSFLDHHLKVGNSVVGVGDIRQLSYGIAKDAFKALSGDDEDVCKVLKKTNTAGLKSFRQILENERNQGVGHQGVLFSETTDFADEVARIDAMPSDTLADEEKKAAKYREIERQMASNALRRNCDLYMAGYLSPKTQETLSLVPTSEHLGRRLLGAQVTSEDENREAYAERLCREAKVFHWPLEFSAVMAKGGFDCVLGNPPWEKAKIEDKKWFGSRKPEVAKAKTAAIRKKMIKALEDGTYHVIFEHLQPSEALVDRDKALHAQYVRAGQQAEAASVYGHVKGEDGGRFPLTGKRDTNLYAYVAELMTSIRKPGGSIGIVVPPGLVTEDAAKEFAQKMLDGEISTLYQFDNTEKIFPIDSRYSFALITFRKSEKMESVFYASNVMHLSNPARKVFFEKGDFWKFNPNTGTCFFPRTKRDLELCRKIYDNCGGVFVKERDESKNPWSLKTIGMFHMTNDSGLFHMSNPDGQLVPLYEGKMIHQFDLRFASFDGVVNSSGEPVPSEVDWERKKDSAYQVKPRFWVRPEVVGSKLLDKGDVGAWCKGWVLTFRSISRSTDQRTLISCVLPSCWGVGNSSLVLFPSVSEERASCLLSNLNSIVLDYVVRVKQTGANLNQFIFKQLPVLHPKSYQGSDIEYIATRTARLTKNADVLSNCWLKDYPSEPYQDPKERLQIRAELDAYFAHLYGLSRTDLEYILDPISVCGPDHPSVTFPGLKRDEIAQYGEYLTQRLVLEAYDALAKTPRFAKTTGTAEA